MITIIHEMPDPVDHMGRTIIITDTLILAWNIERKTWRVIAGLKDAALVGDDADDADNIRAIIEDWRTAPERYPNEYKLQFQSS